MYILALSLDWFITVPGIMITLGVVLLIIALVLFILGSKKAKTEKKVENTEVNTPVVEEASINQEAPATMDANINQVEVQPEVSEPKFEEVAIGTPGIDPINPVVEPTVSTDELPQVGEVNTEEVSIEMPEVTGLDQTMVSVYGEEVAEEPKVTIYGGNDPLEATQNLPKVEEHHEPYGGAINEVKIVEPVEENVIQIPEVEPISIETPEVKEESISFEIPSQPVEISSEVVEIPATEEPVNVVEIPTSPIETESQVVEIPSVVPEVVEIPVEEQKSTVEEL